MSGAEGPEPVRTTRKRCQSGDLVTIGDVVLRIPDDGPRRIYLEVLSDHDIKIERPSRAAMRENL